MLKHFLVCSLVLKDNIKPISHNHSKLLLLLLLYVHLEMMHFVLIEIQLSKSVGVMCLGCHAGEYLHVIWKHKQIMISFIITSYEMTLESTLSTARTGIATFPLRRENVKKLMYLHGMAKKFRVQKKEKKSI